MTRNPLMNATLATLYIGTIASGLFYIPHYIQFEKLGVMVPVTMLSLFVLSAASMGAIFLLQPLKLCFEGKPHDGATLFLQTVGLFSIVVMMLVTSLLFFGLK